MLSAAMFTILEIIIMSVMIRPQSGRETWSVWTEGGAEAAMLAAPAATWRILSRGLTTPSRVMVVPFGVHIGRLGVCQGGGERDMGFKGALLSLVLSDISTSLTKSLRVTGMDSAEEVGEMEENERGHTCWIRCRW